MKRVARIAAFGLGLLLVLGLAYLHPALSMRVPIAAPKVTAAKQPASTPNPLPSPARPPQSAAAEKQLLAEVDEETPESPKPFDEVIKGKQKLDGLFTLYRDRNEGKLYAEIKPDQLNFNYLATVTLESGIGQNGIYSGLPLVDFLFMFRRVDNKVQFLVPNVYFRTYADDPLRSAVQRAFSGSVLQTLPIKAYHPKRKSLLVDLSPLFLSDFPGLTPLLNTLLSSTYTLNESKTYFGTAKNFPQNVEIESVYGFSGANAEALAAFIETVPDSRTFNLKVRYSLSQIPTNNGYRSRAADERVGYFVTAFQNFSDDSPKTPFVRYINRWHLEKQNPELPLSPPKNPIVFWIENTVPFEYRDAVRDGILMWNKAFEKAGFQDAIQVKQMPPNATWDPADIRYNTIRWITTFDGGFLGIGPSRVNPLTGEILDADVLIDASFSRYLKQQYQTLVQANRMRSLSSLAQLSGTPDLCSYGLASDSLKRSLTRKASNNPHLALKLLGSYDLCYGMEATRQLAIGSMAMTMIQGVSPDSSEMKQYVKDFLRMLIAHEVGHTLGLRHNFKGSAMLSPAELNNRDVTRQKGLVSSVMDYSAVNLAPVGTKQGDYFSQIVGPYDEWAIAYGYTPLSPLPNLTEKQQLEKIAQRASEPELAYATDEDTVAQLDPLINRFDLSNDLLTYAPEQMAIANQMWQRLEKYKPSSRQQFGDTRMMFDEIFDYYFQYSRFLVNFVGGQSFNRSADDTAPDRLPFESLPLAKQRQALALLQKYVFDANQFRFSPAFLNKLTPSRWSNWGETPEVETLDYPIYDRILLLQSAILSELMNYDRLARLRDAELKSPDQALTIPELFDTLQTTIWQEVLKPDDKLHLSSLRRGLQRQHLTLMTAMVLRSINVPEDARTLAWYNLKQLYLALDKASRRANKADAYTRAHLEESRDRIIKTLNAQLQSQ